MSTQFISCAFKLHKPSTWKLGLLEQVFFFYSTAIVSLLDFARQNIDQLRRDGRYIPNASFPEKYKFTDKSIAPLLPRPAELSYPIAASLKEAAVKNVAAMVASYLALDESDSQAAGFPVARDIHPEEYPNALDEFCSIYLKNTLDVSKRQAEVAENEARYNLLRKVHAGVMPLHFVRSRDFALLVQADGSRFFLWMKLATKELNPGRTVIKNDNLINLADRKPFKYNGSSGILFPLEVGWRNEDWGWQYQKFIQPTLQGLANIRAAKLIEKNGEYFIHISFEIETPEVFEPQAYLGVNRGIIHSIGYGIVDLSGNVLQTGHSDDPFRVFQERAKRRVQERQKRFAKISKADYRQQELDDILHSVVNNILDIATQHKAVLVLEDWSLINVGKFYRSAYTKINNIINYKAALRGVPVMRQKVFSAYASQICIHCGGILEREAYSRIAKCVSGCPDEHVDEVNGVNIARRILYKKEKWKGDKDQPGDWRAFHRSFANSDDLRAKNDLRNSNSKKY